MKSLLKPATGGTFSICSMTLKHITHSMTTVCLTLHFAHTSAAVAHGWQTV